MATKKTGKSWPPKRIAALVLTLLLAALAVYGWRAGTGDERTLPLLGVGIALGLLYTIRGGSLPDFIHRASRSHFAGGSGITKDDDPRNLPPRLYLPILLVVILVAVILYLCFGRR